MGFVPPSVGSVLNDSGESLVTRVVAGGAVHVSCNARTLAHAHYAWKIVVGLDAPIWFRSAAASIAPTEAIRAVIVPPGLHHEVGAVGLNCAVFGAPGSRGTPWHTSERHWVPDAAHTRRILGACRRLLDEPRASTLDVVDEVFGIAFDGFPPPRVDARVRRVLKQLKTEPVESLSALASRYGLSPDRLSHLVKQDTGMALRKHVVWSRLMALLSRGEHYPSLAAAAAAAGFSDHAHLTRTYRNYLGRLPSDFSGPPDVLRPW